MTHPLLARTLLIGLATSAAFGQAVAVRSPTTLPAVWQRGEWAVDPGQTYANPYDPTEVAVDGVFCETGGDRLTLPAFWQPGQHGGGRFVLRFAPPHAGHWTLGVRVSDRQQTREAGPLAFDVAGSDTATTSPATSPAGVPRVAANRRYFRFEDGRTFFPVGLNLAWSRTPPANDPNADWYDRTFAMLAGHGGNFARVWLCHPPAVIESAASGLGRYDEQAASYFDHVLESADRHGLRVMLCLLNHRDFLNRDMWGEAGWPTHPYNAKNGGPATRPADVFTDPAARQHMKARLRYLVARYAAYQSLAFWELFNEQEFAGTAVPAAWMTEMAAGLADPYGRLVVTSAGVPREIKALPAMAFTQDHLYGNGHQPDAIPSVTSAIADAAAFDKPHLIAELGLDAAAWDGKYDKAGLGTNLHDTLWAAALGGAAGGGMYWYWDNYVEPKNLWWEYGPLAEFVRGVDFAGKDFRPIALPELRRPRDGGPIDLNLPAAGDWASPMPGSIAVPPSGRPNRVLPLFFFGAGHADRHAAVNLDVELAAESKWTVRAAKVSDYLLLRVSVDGRPTGDMLFSATPGTAGIGKSVWNDRYRLYTAEPVEPRTLPTPIPAGKHRVTLDGVAGDWIVLDGVTFENAVDAGYANLAVLALQDAATLETLAWVYDPRSNWVNDVAGKTPPTSEGVTLVVPNVTAGTWTAAWHDTRRGGVVRTDTVSVVDGKLTLTAPPFTRDIAVRVTRVP